MQTTTINELSPPEREKIINFLKSHPVGILATVNPQGDPHASAVYLSLDEDSRITFTTKRETHKYKNISAHNDVMVVIYDARTQTAVQVIGKAAEVTDPEQQLAIYRSTIHAAQQTGPDTVPPIAKIPAGAYVGFTIEIENIWMNEYGWGDSFANAMQHVHDIESHDDPA